MTLFVYNKDEKRVLCIKYHSFNKMSTASKPYNSQKVRPISAKFYTDHCTVQVQSHTKFQLDTSVFTRVKQFFRNASKQSKSRQIRPPR